MRIALILLGALTLLAAAAYLLIRLGVRVARTLPDTAWAPSKVKPMISAPYCEQTALKAAKRARTRTASGRVWRKPAKADVVRIETRRKA